MLVQLVKTFLTIIEKIYLNITCTISCTLFHTKKKNCLFINKERIFQKKCELKYLREGAWCSNLVGYCCSIAVLDTTSWSCHCRRNVWHECHLSHSQWEWHIGLFSLFFQNNPFLNTLSPQHPTKKIKHKILPFCKLWTTDNSITRNACNLRQ